MTIYYGVSAPLGSGKTTAAIEFAGYAAMAGEKVAIVQPTIRLIDESIKRFRKRWPDVAVRAVHSDLYSNVPHEIAEHTRSSFGGQVLFITHATLMQAPFWDRRKDWHLIVDEAPQVTYNCELVLPDNHSVVLPALDTEPYNIRYSRLVPGDLAMLERIGENRLDDMVSKLFQELAQKLASYKWDMYVLSEQFERFRAGEITDGRLQVFGLVDPLIFDGFADVTLMSANLERTIVYQHLVKFGHVIKPHVSISKKLRYQRHENGDLLTVHYAVESGNWTKHARNRHVQIDEGWCTVNDLITAGALDLFGDQPFVWLTNKDIQDEKPFGECGHRLPHSPHGLNSFQHFHNAAVLPALNPSKAFYSFLDEVAHLNSDEVRQAVYHEAAYQAAGRISLRNPEDSTPKHLVVADRAAAEAIADIFPGAKLQRLPFAEFIPQAAKPGPKRIHASDAERKKAHRDRHQCELLRQLDEVTRKTNYTIGYKDNSSRRNATFGGSLFTDIWHKYPTARHSGLSPADFIEFLRDLHARNVAKQDAWLWSPAEFEKTDGVATGRGLANITAIHGVFLDNDGGGLSYEEFAAMFPNLHMVVHNSASSMPGHVKWRAIIPTTCAMTIDVHREIMLNITKALSGRGFFDKKQLAKRAAKGLGGKCHGFDPSKFNAASMFYLPAQAAAGLEASFFKVFDGGKRQPINPYDFVKRTIANHQPDSVPKPVETKPVPASIERKDPKLTRALRAIQAEEHGDQAERHRQRVDEALSRWRAHPKGTGHHEFFLLAVGLASAEMESSEIRRALYDEAEYAHGTESRRDRRAAIPGIISKLRCAA